MSDTAVRALRVADVPRRLVVELNARTAATLAELVDEEELNKTTIVNRAVQVYALLSRAQRDGAALRIATADGAEREVHFL